MQAGISAGTADGFAIGLSVGAFHNSKLENSCRIPKRNFFWILKTKPWKVFRRNFGRISGKKSWKNQQKLPEGFWILEFSKEFLDNSQERLLKNYRKDLLEDSRKSSWRIPGWHIWNTRWNLGEFLEATAETPFQKSLGSSFRKSTRSFSRKFKRFSLQKSSRSSFRESSRQPS